MKQAAPKDHSVQFYKTEKFLYDSVGGYAVEALSKGSSVIIIATEPHRRGIAQKIADAGLDPDQLQEDERFISLDASAMLSEFMVNGDPQWESFKAVTGKIIDRASRGGKTEVCAYGEMVNLLWKEGRIQQAIRLEEQWNHLTHFYPFSLLCAYQFSDRDETNGNSGIEDICRVHTDSRFEEKRPETSRQASSVLIAEDDEDDYLFVAEVFRRDYPSIQLLWAKDGEEALSILNSSEKKPSLVILDLNMPKQDGRQTLGLIRAKKDLSELPVVVFTTSASELDKRFINGFNGASFATKPHSYSEYSDFVRGVVSKYRLG